MRIRPIRVAPPRIRHQCANQRFGIYSFLLDCYYDMMRIEHDMMCSQTCVAGLGVGELLGDGGSYE